ncbi:glycoside hydrolase family 15 protein [Streptomyces sp. NBC_01764]|uniref:glycoside hydrolase family 15 protein n=1 Tax=Streptomyces sp. NBC_01764 TaxID=2975935 RepID=UPI002B1CD6FB|nr:glycoside hydrolase family 15 protein [Streptomyces sp. NBC_01764]
MITERLHQPRYHLHDLERAACGPGAEGSWSHPRRLLAEETDSTTAEALGNFPQAFSHIGLINAARAIRDAERQEMHA